MASLCALKSLKITSNWSKTFFLFKKSVTFLSYTQSFSVFYTFRKKSLTLILTVDFISQNLKFQKILYKRLLIFYIRNVHYKISIVTETSINFREKEISIFSLFYTFLHPLKFKFIEITYIWKNRKHVCPFVGKSINWIYCQKIPGKFCLFSVNLHHHKKFLCLMVFRFFSFFIFC